MYQGSNFGGAASSGQLTDKISGERPTHSLLVDIVILANLTSLSTSIKVFFVLSFTMVYHAPPSCSTHLVDALERAVNPLQVFWLSPPPPR
jgi:hypothetical protein